MSTSNSTLSDSDIEALSQIGHDTVENIVSLIVEAVLYTVYFVLVVILGRILLKSRNRTKASIIIFAIILTMLMLDTAICIIDVHNVLLEVTATLYPTQSSESLADRLANFALPWMWIVETPLIAFTANLGDAIIIWRTWAFYRGPRERWVLLIPVSLLVGSLISSSLLAYCVTKYDPNELGDFPDAPFCENLSVTQGYSWEQLSFILATTAAATGMICWKTWIYRRSIGLNLGINKSKTRAEKIMLILIESGLLYFLFFVQVAIGSSKRINAAELSTPNLMFATNIWTYMENHIIGIYPVVVVILVRSQRSYIEDAMTSVESTPSFSSHTHSDAGSHSLPSHRFDHGTSTVGTEDPSTRPSFTQWREHFLDFSMREQRHARDDLSFSDMSAMRVDGEVQSVKSRPKEVSGSEKTE